MTEPTAHFVGPSDVPMQCTIIHGTHVLWPWGLRRPALRFSEEYVPRRRTLAHLLVRTRSLRIPLRLARRIEGRRS